jgi:thiol-disulfide isomerase/thioredoxin
MKKFLFTLTFFALSFSSMGQYDISFSSNVRYGKAFMAYYMGKNLNVQDSAIIPSSGTVRFVNKEKVPGGIYTIVFGNNKFSADFLLTANAKLKIISDTTDLSRTNISGNEDNNIFTQYQNFVAEKGKLLGAERRAYEMSTTRQDSAMHEANYTKLNTELNAYRQNLIDNNPTAMISGLLLAMKGGPLPVKAAYTSADSLENFLFYKAHYWDDFAFNDGRLVRTPFFIPRLENYYRVVMQQMPADSIIEDIDYKLLLARTAPEMYKYLLNWLTDEYINPKYMGQDAVFVHLFQKYHSQGETSWLNEKQIKTITDRAYMQMSNLIGVKAADLKMMNWKEQPTSLYNTKADYTVLLFWDPTCGHCKQELPRIDSIYNANWKAKGVKIFAVLSENQHPLWLSYIKENKLEDWTHVYQTAAMIEQEKNSAVAGYRQLFDVIQTPTILLLDADKNIIAKKLSIEQLNEFLTVKTLKGKN